MEELLNAEETLKLVKAMIRLYPQEEPELTFTNHFELLCAVVLSAQTTDIAVNKVTPALFEAYPTPEAMAQAKPEEIAEYIKTIGLFNNKAKFLVQLSKQLVEEFGGKVPRTRKELMSLPGVGRKTANVVMFAAFGLPAFAVDTHINRVCKRFHFVPEKATVRQVEDVMISKLPEELWGQAHHSILLFGRHQCVAGKHDHAVCLERLKQAIEANEKENR